MRINKKFLAYAGITAAVGAIVLGCALVGSAGTQLFGNGEKREFV